MARRSCPLSSFQELKIIESLADIWGFLYDAIDGRRERSRASFLFEAFDKDSCQGRPPQKFCAACPFFFPCFKFPRTSPNGEIKLSFQTRMWKGLQVGGTARPSCLRIRFSTISRFESVH